MFITPEMSKMNKTHKSELSLYSLVKRHYPKIPTVTVTQVAWENMCRSWWDILIHEKLSAQLWLKLSNEEPWSTLLKCYQDVQGNPRVYLCSIGNNIPLSINDNTIRIQLEDNNNLQKEFFIIIDSPTLMAVLLGQQDGKDYKLILSLESSVVKLVINTIKDIVVISDDNASMFLDTEVDIPYCPSQEVITRLFLKQVTYTNTPEVSTVKSQNNNSNFLQQAFISQLVQNLRLPLTNMKTAIFLLDSKQIKSEQRQRYIQLLQTELEHQSTLVNSLQQLADLENNPVDKVANLVDILPSLVSTYQSLARENKIQLGYTIPTGLPSVACPPSWLKYIILELLSNSLKFTPSKGKILVQSSLDGPQVVIDFSDTGVGISTEAINKVFDSFYRGKDNNGTGLGLSIVKQLVEQCGGSITVVSTEGKGSSFKVCLPTSYRN